MVVEAEMDDWLQVILVEDVDALLDGDLPPSGLLLSDRREVSGQAGTLAEKVEHAGAVGIVLARVRCAPNLEAARQRSEEHTSELQSRGHLVCRLLLEKKNKMIL